MFPPARCSLSAADRAWLDRSVRGWIAVRRDVLRAPAPASLDAIMFDRRCMLTSGSAMRTGEGGWTGRPFAGPTVEVGSQRIPAGVVSATIGDRSGTRFVMSTPSVWQAHGVAPGVLGLERLMTAVMIHEATHVFQMASYGRQVEALQKANRLSDEQFNDDAIQARFGGDRAFADSIGREIDLFFAAARAPDVAEARRLARAARKLMRVRASRSFIGDQSYQRRAEDLWLTMEGAGQWAGYRWLLSPAARAGGGAAPAEAMAGFGRRGRSWTQLLGLGVALTLDRLSPTAWRRHAFGDGRLTALEMLDGALDERTGGRAG